MANETTFSIKFEGYDKTFKNINAIVGELSDMKEELLQLEKALAEESDTTKWDELNKQINKTEQNIKDFEKAVLENTEITDKALKKTIQLQQESIKQSEEVAKQFEEAFSPEAIIEFSAKAGAAFIGLSEGFIGTGEAADKATERLGKALVKINGIKDSAEIAILGLRKANSTMQLFADRLSKGGAAAQGLGKAMNFLSTGLKGPFLLITAITGAVTLLIQSFGGLANTINFVSDSLGGLLAGFKALIELKNPLTAFNDEFARLGEQRGLEKDLETINNLQGDIDVLVSKYQRYIDQSLTNANTQDLVNKQYDLQNKFLVSQVVKLTELANIETDLGKKQEYKNEISAKTVQLVDLLNAKEQKLRELQLDTIENVLTKQNILDSYRKNAINENLRINTASTQMQIEGINKVFNIDIDSINRRIKAFQNFGALDEKQTLELEQLKSDASALQIEKQIAIDEAIKNSGTVQRAILTEINALKTAQFEKELQFVDARTQAGVDQGRILIQNIQALKEAEINAELEKYALIKSLTDEDKTRQQQLINELETSKKDSEQRILDLRIKNIDFEASRAQFQLQLNEKLRNQESEINKASNNEQARLLELNAKFNEKRLTQTGAIFRVAKMQRDLESQINAEYENRQELINQEKADAEAILELEKQGLLIDKARLETKSETVELLDTEKEQLNQINDLLAGLEKDKVKIQLEFQTASDQNATQSADQLKEAKGAALRAAIDEAGVYAQALNDVTGLVVQAQVDALNNQLSVIEENRSRLEESLSRLQEQLGKTQSEIDSLEKDAAEAKGSRQRNILEQLQREELLRDKISEQIKAEEQQKKQLAKEEANIREQQVKALRLQTQIQATLTLAQSIGAVASAAAVSNVAAPVIVPLVVAAIAAGFAAVKSFASGFAEGGYTGKGKKYEPAGIVHKGEYVIPAWQVENPTFKGAINFLESNRKKGLSLSGYAEGGKVLSPDFRSISESVDVSTSDAVLINAIRALNLTVSVTEIENRQRSKNNIKVKTAI